MDFASEDSILLLPESISPKKGHKYTSKNTYTGKRDADNEVPNCGVGIKGVLESEELSDYDTKVCKGKGGVKVAEERSF